MPPLSMLVSLLLLAAGEHFTVTAELAPPPPGADRGAVVVTFTPTDPDVRVNQEPAPRLKLDPEQKALLDRQPPSPSRIPAFDPATAKYLDPETPVRFPVAWAPGAPKGHLKVKGTVVYFYCSKREAWCRKGSAGVEVPVSVP